jgi:hypothetical protein
MNVRALNPEGISRFRTYLAALRLDPKLPPPSELLTDPETSVDVLPATPVEQPSFNSRKEAAKYLAEALVPLKGVVDHNSGLWTWLSLFFFDQVCPPDGHGAREPGQDPRHILPPVTDGEHFRHYYRHLLAGPHTIYSRHPNSGALLAGALDEPGDFNEQIASRQFLIQNKGLVEAVDILYFDPTRAKTKRGATSTKGKPGALRRLVKVIRQVNLTYDLYAMNGPEIVAILPKEFDSWAKRAS